MNVAGLRLARSAAQLLHRPDPRTSVDALVTRLLAVQAQDMPAARLAIRARARRLTATDVDAALAERAVVRAWGPRGTLHLIGVDDLPWVLALVGPPRVANSMRRLGQEGVAGTEPELLRVVTSALAGQGPLTKSALGRRLATAGVPAKGQGIVHLAALGAFHGRVVHGPDEAGKPTYVHAADWLGNEIRFEADRQRALAELALRYLRTRGPAEPADLAAWSGLPLGEARTGWAAIASELVDVEYGGRILHRLRGRAPSSTGGVVRLLPAFDEYLLSWRSREPAVSAEHARAVHPGGGVIRPCIVVDGEVVGTWRLRAGRVVPELFTNSSGTAGDEAIATDAADVTRFLAADDPSPGIR